MTRWQRDFRKLWIGESASLIGTQVSTLVIPLIAVSLLDATPVEVGLLAAVGSAPFLLLGIPAGLIADRLRRRPLLIAANLMQLFGIGSIPVIGWLGELTVYWMLPGLAVAGCGRVLFQVCYRAYLPSVVPAEHLTGANARLSASESVAEIGGPSIGGALTHAAGASALLIDVVSHLVSIVGLLMIRRREPEPDVGVRTSASRRIAQGFRFVMSDANLRAFVGEAAGYNLFWAAIEPLLLLLAIRELGLSEGAVGLALGVGAIGALLGAVTTQRAARRFGLGATLVISVVAGDVAPLALPFVPESQFALPILGAIMFIRGIGITGCNVHTMTIRQTITPPGLQGRANAAYVLVANGMTPVGALLGGALGASMGLQPALIATTVGLLATSAFIVFSPARHLRSIDDLLPSREGSSSRVGE